MSVIQTIRDKAAWLVFGLIALSLIGFLLMDAFVGRSRFFGGNSTVIGTADGQKMQIEQFDLLVKEQEDQYSAKGYPVNDMISQNIKEGVWKEFVEESVLNGIYKKLAMEVSDKEMNDLLVGQNAIPEIRQSFTDPKTGIFDAQAAAQTINQLRSLYVGKKKSDKNYEEARRFFEEGIPQIIKNRLKEKYLALLTVSTYIPRWMANKLSADNSLMTSISYVDVPYTTIPDSAVKVSDDEIRSYVDRRKDQFKQQESRSIAYVSFDASPTAADSAAIRQQLINLKQEFSTTTDVSAFLARNGTEIPYSETYVPKAKIEYGPKDSLTALAKGAVYGPYLDGGNFVLAKLVDEKEMPDSVKARHILVALTDPATGQPVEDSLAKKKIDSVQNLIEHGARFDSLAAKLSADQSSRAKGGELGWFAQGKMVAEFNSFCFAGKKGDKKIIKSQYGYHLVEIEDQKQFEPAYEIAQFAKKIDASQETDQNANGLANQFAGESLNRKAFDQHVRDQKLQRLLAPEIAPIASSIPGLGTSRQLVRWAYQASIEDVSEPTPVGEKYVVAMLTEINKEGTMSVAKAAPLVEPILRKQKKGELIDKKIAAPQTLEAVASATGQSVRQVDSINFASPYIPNLGQEPLVIGAVFNKAWQGKSVSPLINGNGGVFVFKPGPVFARANSSGTPEQVRSNLEQMQASMVQRTVFETLVKTADVKDNRANFF